MLTALAPSGERLSSASALCCKGKGNPSQGQGKWDPCATGSALLILNSYSRAHSVNAATLLLHLHILSSLLFPSAFPHRSGQ
jgi:hypothetical protein